jgi:Icc-related predicted phosphoesterase
VVKICCISDTHNQHRKIEIPECDVLIHSGDYSYTGDFQSIWEINQWFGKLKSDSICKEVITVAGNHDFGFEKNSNLFRPLMTNCIYLQDEPLDFMGFKWYGSPRTPTFGRWAFMNNRGKDIKKYWDRIPDDTQILITHGSPYGILDEVDRGIISGAEGGREHVGCEELRKRVDQLKDLKLHCFGHLHDNNGQFKDNSGKLFVNAAICDESYSPIQPPQVINL